MHGNVWEWCQDRYTRSDYTWQKASQTDDPQGPSQGSLRANRGGNWVLGPEYCRSAYRNGFSPSSRYVSVGFRVAAVPAGKEGIKPLSGDPPP